MKEHATMTTPTNAAALDATAKDTLVVSGLGRHVDGDYPFNIVDMLTVGAADSLTNREGHTIKRISGVRVGEIEEALTAGDNDLYVALATVILNRHGKRIDEDRIWDAPMGAIRFDLAERGGDDEEDDESLPPDEPAAPEPTPSESGGPSSSHPSDNQENDPSRTGHPGSDTSATSDQQTLAT